MAFCPNCGSQVAGRFCPNCGTDVGAAASAGAAGAAPNPGAGTVPPATPIAAPGLTENVASALCYLFGFITGIVFLLIAPYNTNKTVRFHAFQSIFLNLAIVVIDIALVIVAGMLAVLHLWFVLPILWPVFGLVIFCLWLYLMYSAYNNRRIVLPIVGQLAAKQA